MKTSAVDIKDLQGVFAVPPLARNKDEQFSINFGENKKILRHIADGGITRFLIGGNAFLYHISLSDYHSLLEWMNEQPDTWWMIPSAGPSFGRAIDQASLLRQFQFPAVMLLPCSDPLDAKGLEKGLRLFAEASSKKLILYLKTEDTLGANKQEGIDMLARLVDDGICVAIKYAIPRADPTKDEYLTSVLRSIDVNRIVSGIGERPAIEHLFNWDMAGFTTGSGCIQPQLCSLLFESCFLDNKGKAESLRQEFLPLEDLRDAWNPAKVLHHATALAGIADTGPILPFLSSLSTDQLKKVGPAANHLANVHNSSMYKTNW